MTQENELLIEAALQKLKESKESTIKKLVNLDDGQKKILTDYFMGPGQAWWKDIDWNKYKTLTWDDFQIVLNKSSVGGLDYGIDYVKIHDGVFNGEPYVIYQPLTHRGAKVLQSNDIPPVRTDNGMTAAKWCIGWQRSDEYWNRYNRDGDKFYFIFGETIPTKKVAIQMQEDGTNVVWDYTDSTSHPVKFKELPPDAQEIVNKLQNGRAEKALEELIASVKAGQIDKVTYENGRFNFDGLDRYEIRRRFFNKSDDFIKVPVGSWTGTTVRSEWFNKQEDVPLSVDVLIFEGNHGYNPFGAHAQIFDFSNCVVRNKLDAVRIIDEDLPKLPTTVIGTVNFGATELTSFEGWGAKKVKKIQFNSDGCKINSFKGCPDAKIIIAENVNLTSLEGCPSKVRVLDVSNNHLATLEGAPREVSDIFRADHNELQSLEGGPKEGDFSVEYNISGNPELASLVGCPKDIEGQFNASACPSITSLEGAPEDVGNGIFLRGTNILREEIVEYIKGIRG